MPQNVRLQVHQIAQFSLIVQSRHCKEEFMQLYCSHVHSHEARRILFTIPRIASLCTYINYSSEQHRIVWEDHRIKLVYVEKQGARRVRLVQIVFKNTQMSIPATLFSHTHTHTHSHTHTHTHTYTHTHTHTHRVTHTSTHSWHPVLWLNPG